MGLYLVNCIHCGKPFMWFSGGGLAECTICKPPTQTIATSGTTIPTGTMVGKTTTTSPIQGFNLPSCPIDMTPTPHHVGCRRCSRTWSETGYGPQIINGASYKYDYCSECKDDPVFDLFSATIKGNPTIK